MLALLQSDHHIIFHVIGECALYGSSVLAFAAVCGVDDTNQRPSVGFINICYKVCKVTYISTG